jgi:hypothetical protein
MGVNRVRNAKKSRKKAVQELQLTEHAARLRSLPGSAGEMLKTVLIWVAAGIVLMALAWLTLGR